MELRVVLLCMVTAYAKTQEDHGGGPRPRSRDARGAPSDVREGFVQPLDFATFTQEFVGEDRGGRDGSFPRGKTSFGAESKKSGAFHIPNSEFASFQGQIFPHEHNASKTGFVQPVQFVSSFDKEADAKVYKTNINPTAASKDQVPKATEEEDDEDSHYNPSRVQSFRHSPRPHKPKAYAHGKSSYPAPKRRPSPSHYYPTNHKDVEMILPKDKVLFLPMVNGKPKPYDGYRAAPESEGYETFEKEEARLREKRLNEGEIIYGKPKIALSELYHRQQRSPAEYYGGIYPYYDYSDAKLSVGGDTDPTNHKKKKTYPKKHRQGARDKSYNPYKYPKESPKRRHKEEDSRGYASGESSEEAEDDSDEDTQETKGDAPFYKYSYDDTVKIPPLEIKRYPYEKDIRDSHVEGSRRDESYDHEDNVDEYTAGYERYVKTLPSDLETYFGTPELNDKFTVEATENLENNKNCKKVDTPPPKQEEGSDKEKAEEQAETQVCYVCSDPKTGDSYEQCAYRSQPKSQKYFFGGTTSFQSNETAEPTTYRYKRSAYPYLYHPYALEESESSESEQQEEYHKKPKKSKKYRKQNGKKHPKRRNDPYKDYNPFFKLQEASSTKRGRRAKADYPPRSYDGPKYTYEGPEETYEGPAQHYEGPKETYEGPAEPYEGPINQEYYDTVDERIEDDEEESKQEAQTSAPPKSRHYSEYGRQKPKKRQSYSSRYDRPYRPSRYSGDEYEDSYRPGYASDYRFGPEHFVDEGEPEDTKRTEQVKPTSPPKSPEKRGPHKFPPSEARSAAASDKQEKEESIGEVKVFKNGDVCQKKRKEGMICMVCKNEKTAATYEQCQYSTRPKEKYYAYGSQKSYTTKNPEAEKKPEAEEEDPDQFPEKSDIVEKKILITTQSKVFGYDPAPTEGLAVAESKNSPRILPRDAYGDYADNIETLSDEQNQNDTNSKDFRESIERIEPRDGIEGLEEYLYDAEDSEHKATEDEKRSYKSYDDYFRDLFPEFAKSAEPVPDSEEKEESESERHLAFDPFSNVRRFHEENARREDAEEDSEEEEKDAEASRPEELRLKDRRSRIPSDFFLPYNEENHKKDLEKALGEFQNKDWSNCKKIVKKKLTCYQCVDKNGVNNEECMYVEASQPILKHLAYHEKKELKAPEGRNKTIEPSTELAQPENTEKTLKRFRKAKNSHEELIQVAEPPRDAEYVEKSARKGDFEAVEKPPDQAEPETVAGRANATEATPEATAPKPRGKKQKRHPKKRNKTRRNETTTERFETIRKRKFPLKKFAETEESPPEGKPEDGSFGLKNPTEPNLNHTVGTESG